jgi:hypothetical protein
MRQLMLSLTVGVRNPNLTVIGSDRRAIGQAGSVWRPGWVLAFIDPPRLRLERVLNVNIPFSPLGGLARKAFNLRASASGACANVPIPLECEFLNDRMLRVARLLAKRNRGEKYQEIKRAGRVNMMRRIMDSILSLNVEHNISTTNSFYKDLHVRKIRTATQNGSHETRMEFSTVSICGYDSTSSR